MIRVGERAQDNLKRAGGTEGRLRRGNLPYGRAAILRVLFPAAFLIAFLLGTFFFFHGTGSVVKADEPLTDIQYKVVEVEYGDSLWSIARENMHPGFSDVYEYIHEVKRCNQLSSDEIEAGCYLMIPYYEYR